MRTRRRSTRRTSPKLLRETKPRAARWRISFIAERTWSCRFILSHTRSIQSYQNTNQPTSLLAKCPRHLIAKRLEQIRNDRSFARLNEAFDRHAGYQLKA